MEGAGSYNAHSHPQATAAELGVPALVAAARAMPIPATGTALIADYGASQGRNSLAPMRAAIDAARAAHGPSTPLAVVHTDLPANDFSSLFETVVHDPGTYLRPGVFALAAGRSFYEQVLPPASVALGWSSITVHWLSAPPGPMEDGIWSPSAAPAVRAAWARRSAEDWRAFLAARAAELMPGGRLVIVGSGADAEGRSGAEGAMGMIDAALRAMVSDDALAAHEYAAMAVPTWYRTLDEWRAPFPCAGLELERCEPAVLADPFWPAYEASRDAAAYAAQVAAFLRAAFEPVLAGALAPERRDAFAAELFGRRLPAAVAADPAAASCRWQLVLLAIART